MFENRTFSVQGRTYVWFGGFGAIFKSRERGVGVGDCRVISDWMFYAYCVYPRRFSRSEVCWTRLDVTMEEINTIQKRVFGCVV